MSILATKRQSTLRIQNFERDWFTVYFTVNREKKRKTGGYFKDYRSTKYRKLCNITQKIADVLASRTTVVVMSTF